MAKANREILLNALRTVRPALSTYDYVPVLTHICIDNKRVFAFDDTSAIVMPSGIIEGKLRCAVPGKPFIDLIQKIDADEIKLKLDGQTLTVRAGKTRAEVSALPPEHFLFEPSKWKKWKVLPIKTPIPNLIEALKLALIAVPKEYIEGLYGVTFTGDRLYASDTNSLIRIQFEQEASSLSKPILLPTFFVERLASGHLGSRLAIGRGDKYLVVCTERNERLRMFTKMSDDKPLDFSEEVRKFLKPKMMSKLISIPEGLDTSVGRVLVLTDRGKRVDIRVKEGSLELKASGKHGEVKEEIKVSKIGKKVEFSVDADRFINACRTFKQMYMTREATLFSGTLEDDENVWARVDYVLGHEEES